MHYIDANSTPFKKNLIILGKKWSKPEKITSTLQSGPALRGGQTVRPPGAQGVRGAKTI
jgi:hypothetical protein